MNIEHNKILFNILKKKYNTNKSLYLLKKNKILTYKINYNANKILVKNIFNKFLNIKINKINIINCKMIKKNKIINFKKAYIYT